MTLGLDDYAMARILQDPYYAHLYAEAKPICLEWRNCNFGSEDRGYTDKEYGYDLMMKLADDEICEYNQHVRESERLCDNYFQYHHLNLEDFKCKAEMKINRISQLIERCV